MARIRVRATESEECGPQAQEVVEERCVVRFLPCAVFPVTGEVALTELRPRKTGQAGRACHLNGKANLRRNLFAVGALTIFCKEPHSVMLDLAM
ncbi:hypothetical protein NDU88_004275 [Pleurodeles waltl]|uniref:Uncharacterized protein n=1 Tax=Pleurodeles waltl TaxID=8319 RepID=A0AAV7RJ46_PLEWA|nr:hypothetical protein NDU88_004275 [Pleurodeles waltl]